MQIDLKLLQTEPQLELHDVVECPRVADENTEVTEISPVEVAAEASLESSLIRVRGDVAGTVTYICSRCLQPFSAPLTAELAETFSSEALDDDEVVQITGRYIDLDPYIEQTINLNLDPRPLCRQDCKGLCPECGADWNQTTCGCEKRNIDPRFAALEGLILDSDSE